MKIPNRPRVLLVDDYPDARDMYGEYLEYSGYDVIQASNGLEALQRAFEDQPDIILMDLSLPVMDGWEATRRLKANQRTASIPVVALTGHALAGIFEGAQKAGCDAFVTKPCLPEDLVKEIQRVLVYLPLIFLSYVAAAFLAHPKWSDVLRNSLIPHVSFTGSMISGAIALLGTTLTAYAYVWQTVEMSEETTPLSRLGLVQVDATLGTIIAGVTFWFVVIATGATLGVHHKIVQTAQDAANALTPFAGRWAKPLFGIGLLASALIAIPVLSATSAYVASEMFGWGGSIDKKFWRAKKFYVTLVAVLVVGTSVALAGIAPIKLLFISSIAGGLATPITLTMMMLIAGDHRVMKRKTLNPILLVSGWVVTGVVTTAAAIFLFQTFSAKG